uniref:Sperm surface protein Sp17 n=1 Tax=Pelusios castaneus TaxID=367368 RepID=A0A8C8VI79_9SAUR
MSIPFSNTHHRIPLGFANLLEGLAREVLREQPEDIPAFAAKYFEELLDKREETRFDPAEWGAKLEDRFYNNRAFEVGWDCCSVGVSSSCSENVCLYYRQGMAFMEQTSLVRNNASVLSPGHKTRKMRPFPSSYPILYPAT